MLGDRERSAGEAEGKGVTNFLGVHTDERARNGDVGKNSSSSERGGGAGRKTSLGNERGTTSECRGKDDRTMFDIVAMRQGKQGGG
ncbi:hypothetical protein THAOC_19746, partial [Thalassiosira oceanica]